MNARQTFCVLSVCLVSEVCSGADYFIRAGGDNNDPLAGFILSSGAPISQSTTLSNNFGTADVTARADAGAVGIENSGSFTAPPLSTRFFSPQASAISTMFVTFSGNTPTVETSINLDFDGFLSINNFPDFAFTVASGFIIFTYTLGPFKFQLIGGVNKNGAGLDVNDFSTAIVNLGANSFGVSGSGQTAFVDVPVGVPIISQLSLALGYTYLSSGFFGQSFFSGHFNDTISYATVGPVFNLPDGYTVNGDGIVDNRFVGGERATSVPEPAGLPLLALALLVLFVARSTIRPMRPMRPMRSIRHQR